MRHLVPAFLLACIVAGPGSLAASGEDAAPSWNEVQKQGRKAFKRLSIAKHAQLVKSLTPRLPSGIVITAAPFDGLVKNLLAPYAKQLASRERVLASLAQHPSPKAGKLLETAFKTLAKEDADRAKRVLVMEAEYAGVYNAGYMESSEGARRSRKLAAALIPFYRTLLARNAALQELAVDALSAMRTGDALTWLQAAARKSDPALRQAAVLALGRVGGAEAFALLGKAAAGDAEPRVRGAALLALAAWPVKESKTAILAALADEAWEVRALAVAMCVAARLVEAAEPLILQLEKEDGRLRDDIDDALFALVGVRMYADVALWKRWLGENREKLAAQAQALAAEGAYDKPLGPMEDWPERAAADAKDDKRGGTTAFYGITSRSKRIVFLVDISRSMQDEAQEKPPKLGDAKHPYREPLGPSKMAIVRWQLHRAVHDLPKDATFNIVVYSESYKVWADEMTTAKPKAKKAAHKFIQKLVANGTTNIGDTLDKAIALAADAAGGLAADTLYLLSDGNPNRGRLNVLPEVLEDFVRRNRRARLVVHTIGIGEQAGSSFLEDLAKRTGGQYVGFR